MLISLQTVRDETGECKVLIIDRNYAIPTSCTYIFHGSIFDHHHCLRTCDYSAIQYGACDITKVRPFMYKILLNSRV